MVLLIDNYDSFTFNLYQALAVLTDRVEVVRNDRITVKQALALRPTHIVLSPGPRTPNESGICLALIRAAAPTIPILGVCLGHQAVAAAFGGKWGAARQIMHGKTSRIFHDGEGIYDGLPSPFDATRYHSLAVQPQGLPSDLMVTARSEEGEIMGLRHRRRPIFGVQFHPESVLTPAGPALLKNFLRTVH